MNSKQQKRKRLINEFVELLDEYEDQIDDLDLIWDFFRIRPDVILGKLEHIHLGYIKKIEYLRHHYPSSLKIVSEIDAGMRKNWDGSSGCENKIYGNTCEQTVIVSKDNTYYQNRY